MSNGYLNLHVGSDDTPTATLSLDHGYNTVSVRLTGLGLGDITIFATPAQHEALGRGILEAVGRNTVDTRAAINVAEAHATVDQAMAIMRAAMLRETEGGPVGPRDVDGSLPTEPTPDTLAEALGVDEGPAFYLAEVSLDEAIERG